MNPSQVYAGIPGLLQKVINADNTLAWATIVVKIDYIYAHIDYTLDCLNRETGFITEVKSQMLCGK